MKKFNKVTIIGVGLIGGSIGLAVKNRRIAQEVIGVFRRASTMKKALKYRAVDTGVMSVKEGVKNADLIIVASPPLSIPILIKEAARWAKKGAIITDVGSTKEWIVKRIEGFLKPFSGMFFVGSHPMAGSEHASVEYAKSDLLEGSPCIVTRTRNTDKKALRIVTGFWKALGAKVKIMSPAEHDRSVSLISHLPHIVGFSLAGSIPQDQMIYAAEGFRDTTRVASSDPKLWSEIFLTNRKEIRRAARLFELYYNGVIRNLSRGRYSAVMRMLAKAKSKRDKFYGKK